MTAAALALCGHAPALAQDAKPPSCGGATIARGTVTRVLDGRSFKLGDGREVRLAGIEVPSPEPARTADAPPSGAQAALDERAKAALDALVGGDEVVLRSAEIAADRYGRLVGYAYAVRDGDEIFGQGELIAAGLARVADNAGGRTCAADLLEREAAARAAKLGLWADPYYDVLDAASLADIRARQGRFALVAGKVVTVRESGSTIYVNFGRRWSQDFAVTVRKRNERSFATAGVDLKALSGRRVLVRGWIEARGDEHGPWMEAVHPEQIEAAGLQ